MNDYNIIRKIKMKIKDKKDFDKIFKSELKINRILGIREFHYKGRRYCRKGIKLRYKYDYEEWKDYDISMYGESEEICDLYDKYYNMQKKINKHFYNCLICR